MHFHLTKYLLKIFRILFIVHSLSNFWEDCLLLTEVLNQNFEIGICDFDIKDVSSKKYNLYTTSVFNDHFDCFEGVVYGF